MEIRAAASLARPAAGSSDWWEYQALGRGGESALVGLLPALHLGIRLSGTQVTPSLFLFE